MEKFKNLMVAAVKSQFSDLHITGGHPLVFRQNGSIKFDKRFTWTHNEVDELVADLLNPCQLQKLRSRHSVDFALSANNNRIRGNVFNTSRGLSIAVRILSGKVPTLSELNLHKSLRDLCRVKSGLILICGPTGSGKSSTIAGLVDEINRHMATHVVTLEDPVEYRFHSDKSFIEQRELGAHFPSYERGLLDVLREDPDVIVVGELRETEAMRLTLDAAESGHLVIASMHAANVWECLYRFCNSFPLLAQDLVRYQLSTTLKAVVSQQLHYSDRHGFRIPVLSILLSNSSVCGIIRDNKFSQLENVMQMNRSQGMFTFEQYRHEYLDKQTKFIPPSWSTSPVPGSRDEEDHTSSLVDPAALDQPGMQVINRISPDGDGSGRESQGRFEKRTAAVQAKGSEKSIMGFYYIEESGSLEDVINDLRELDKS